MQTFVIPSVILTFSLALGAVPEERRRAVPLREARMTIEWSPGTEALVRISAESEDELDGVRIHFPDGRELVELDSGAPLARGLASLELELPGPTLAALRETYSEGRYDIRAFTVDGRLVAGSAELSFDLPPPTVLVHPRPDEIVRASHVAVGWLRNPAAVAYELQIEQGEDDGLRVKLPPQQATFRVPPGLLARSTPTTVEIVAIGSNGNRTVSEVRFVTAP